MRQPIISFHSKDTECFNGGPSLPSRFAASENISRIEGIVAAHCAIMGGHQSTVCYDGQTLYVETIDGKKRSREIRREALEEMPLIDLANCIIGRVKELKLIEEPLYP